MPIKKPNPQLEAISQRERQKRTIMDAQGVTETGAIRILAQQREAAQGPSPEEIARQNIEELAKQNKARQIEEQIILSQTPNVPAAAPGEQTAPKAADINLEQRKIDLENRPINQDVERILNNLEEQDRTIPGAALIPKNIRATLLAGGAAAQRAFTLSTLAKTVDFVRVAVTGKKPLQHSTALSQFQTAVSSLDASISLVQEGAPAGDFETGFNRALIAINQLEAYQQDFGKNNLNYWSNEGHEVETDIIEMRAILQKKLIQLQQAEQQTQLNQARGQIGLT